MSEPKIAAEVAAAEYARMVEALDGNDGDAVREAMVGAIMAGRLSLDGEALVYTLARPVEHETGGGSTDRVTLPEPNNEDLEYVNRGMKVQTSKGGEDVYVDMGDLYVKARRMITRVGKLPLGIVQRIKRRDMAVLGEICNFFG